MALEDQVKAAIAQFVANHTGTATSVTNFWSGGHTATAFFDGGEMDLIVKSSPIISISSIFDVSASATITATTYGFYTSTGCIYKNNGGDWGNEGDRKRFRVIYVYGYTSIPDDIQLAIDTWVNYLTADNTGSLKSYKTGDDSETYMDIGDMPHTVRALLSRYRRILL